MNRVLALGLLMGVSFGAAGSEPGPLFHFVGKPGPHAVGLKVVEQYDYSRTYRATTDALGQPYRGERARPLQTLIWYPAARDGAKPMTVGDYAKLRATETSFGASRMPSIGQEWLDAMKPTLGAQMWAVRDAAAVSGRFPVVVYAPSFSSPSWENADLCEYLASYGYLVIASPDLGTHTRSMTPEVSGANTQARDISFLIGYAQTLPNADVSEIAVAGFSWGGLSNLFAAARDNRIDALIALDGSLRYWSSLVKEAGDVHPEHMTIPLLYFAQGEFTLEQQEKYLTRNDAPNVLNAWTHGDLVTVRMLGLTHGEHASMFQRNENQWRDFALWQKADYGREDGITGYGWIARYTLAFVDAYLKHDARGMAFLKNAPAENGVARHVLSVSYRAASGVPASLEGFRAEVGRVGFAQVNDVYGAIRKEHADFVLDEVAVNGWAWELIDDEHYAEGIALLELNTRMHAGSSAAHVALGNAYRKSGQTSLAIESFTRALEKDPEESEAKRRLEELRAGR